VSAWLSLRAGGDIGDDWCKWLAYHLASTADGKSPSHTEDYGQGARHQLGST